MGADSKIQWTDHTFNPWWGCARVSPGCEHCYAEAFAKRTGKAAWGVKEPRRFFGEKHWLEPFKWNRVAGKLGERQRVFCASMADVFEDRRDLDPERAKLWEVIEHTPHLDWLLLTKRPENMHRMVPWGSGPAWKNVWLGTTVEDQRRAEERIPHLVNTSAAVRFLSCEPLLERVDLLPWLHSIDWVIVGGESGHGARPFALEWAREILAHCQRVGVTPFVKQIGADPIVGGLMRKVPSISGKGGDPLEWPSDLRVREFPTVRQ